MTRQGRTEVICSMKECIYREGYYLCPIDGGYYAVYTAMPIDPQSGLKPFNQPTSLAHIYNQLTK